MRRIALVALLGMLLGAVGAGPASADVTARTLVFQLRFTGLVATATWTTCPAPAVGDVCTDTIVMAFDAVTRESGGPGPKVRDRTPVLRTLTFVYQVVGGEFGTVPVAEWFGRTEGAVVGSTPRLTRAAATGVVPIQICSVFDPAAGVSCPSSLAVDLAWTGTGPLIRIDDHTVSHSSVRIEHEWTRGWQRTATVAGAVGDAALGTLLAAELARVDQGEFVIQHPVP